MMNAREYMTPAIREGLVAIGPFPPFVGGAAKNTELICSTIESQGIDVRRIPTNQTRVRAEHTRSIATYLDRIMNFFGNLARIYAARRALPNATAYLVPDGGLGVALSAVYARIATLIFARLIVHHRSYGYITKRSFFMALLVKSSPNRILHVFLDPTMKKKFEAVYGDKSPFLIIPNAATCDVEPADGLVASESGLSIGFLSNMVEEKGFDVTAEAFLKLAKKLDENTRFLLAGRPIGPKNERRLAELQRELGGQLDYRGEIFGKEKTIFYRECDIFVFPTRFLQEALPNVLYEAMAAGAALVSTRWVGVPWLLEDTVHRMIEAEADRSDDLVVAVMSLIQSGELAKAKEHQISAFRRKKADADVQYGYLLSYLSGKV